ncbi:yippee putative zinc-binding protein [Ancylostoma duodenale]|uniref:Yippee putative zinc-binding protein n=1 Tax=Ancylostoma duodenale TaxID=51022 RepID=A0A0C2DAU3_9BILA|nr:yippee putative zinc-binding protein [Ancylostoma duodenale]
MNTDEYWLRRIRVEEKLNSRRFERSGPQTARTEIYKERCVMNEHAFESSQKYKEGKFIIELAHMVKDNQWEDGKKRKSI